MSLYLLRHLPTYKNINGIVIGQIDDPILDGYDLVFGKLELNSKLFIFSSPLKRCRQTAAIFLDHLITHKDDLYIQWQVDQDLQERSFGIVQGKDKTQVRAMFPAYYPGGSLDPHCAFPGGEVFEEFTARVERFYSRVSILLATGGDVVVCSHGHVLRVLYCLFLGLNIGENWNKLDFAYGQLNLLEQ